MIAKWRARKAGYDEIVLVDEDGYLAEGPTTNLFMVDRAGRLLTPPVERVLLGVTRDSVIEIAKHDGVPVSEERIRPDALFEAAEVFLTGTSAGVWPVISVDGKPVGAATPGPVSVLLGDHLKRISSGDDPEFAHWLALVSEGGV
jgi:branched-chain amino acid aminotransferase